MVAINVARSVRPTDPENMLAETHPTMNMLALTAAADQKGNEAIAGLFEVSFSGMDGPAQSPQLRQIRPAGESAAIVASAPGMGPKGS